MSPAEPATPGAAPASAAPAPAAPGTAADEAVRVVALWRAAPGNEERVRAILRELAATTGREPGCLGFHVLESIEKPGGFVLIELYASPAAHAGHLATPHFSDLVLDQAVPLLWHRDVQVYSVLTVEGSIPA